MTCTDIFSVFCEEMLPNGRKVLSVTASLENGASKRMHYLSAASRASKIAGGTLAGA